MLPGAALFRNKDNNAPSVHHVTAKLWTQTFWTSFGRSPTLIEVQWKTNGTYVNYGYRNECVNPVNYLVKFILSNNLPINTYIHSIYKLVFAEIAGKQFPLTKACLAQNTILTPSMHLWRLQLRVKHPACSRPAWPRRKCVLYIFAIWWMWFGQNQSVLLHWFYRNGAFWDSSAEWPCLALFGSIWFLIILQGRYQQDLDSYPAHSPIRRLPN